MVSSPARNLLGELQQRIEKKYRSADVPACALRVCLMFVDVFEEQELRIGDDACEGPYERDIEEVREFIEETRQ